MYKFLSILMCMLCSFIMFAQNIVINEILYRRPQASDQIRFIELYNKSDASINLNGYFLEGDINFKFPNGTFIEANSYLLVAENPTALQNYFNSSVNILGPWQGTLELYKGNINLRNPAFVKIDGVSYSGWHLFPSTDISSGRSIQKINPNLSSAGGSWDKSSPTPGAFNNAVYEEVFSTIPIITSFEHVPNRPKPNQSVSIYASIENVYNIFDLSVHLEYQIVNPGNYIDRNDGNYNNGWIPLLMNDSGTNGDVTANDGIYSAAIASNIQTNRRLIRYRIRVNNNTNYNRLFPDQEFDEANFSYFVYDKHSNVNGYDINNLEDLQTFIFISKGVNNSNQNYIGTVVTENDVYDHVDLIRTRFYEIQSNRRNYRANFNDGRPVFVTNDEGKLYSFPKDRLQLSSTEMNDLNSHGLIESLIFKIFELNNVVASFADYTQLRFIDSSNPADDYEGIHIMRDYIRGFKDFKRDFLQQRNLPDGNIYGYRFPFGTLYDGDLPPYGMNNTVFNTWNTMWDDLSDGCSSCDLPIPTQSFLENNIDLNMHYGFMTTQEIIANNETNYAGQHNYYDYYNPISQKFSVIPDDMNATFGAPRDEDGYADRSEWDPNEDVRGPFKEAITNYETLKVAFESRIRSTISLLLNEQQINFLVDNESKRIYNSNNNFNWTDVDKSKWNQQYNNYNDVKQAYKDFFIQRRTYLENTYNSSKMPQKPVITYTGSTNYPLNQLSFNNTDFTDPQGNNTFAALEWRVGEWSDPNNSSYNNMAEDKYEITPIWQSGELTSFSNTQIINASNLIPGRSYKVRVRYKDNTGRWSYWSDPVEFIGGNPVNYNAPDIKFTEIMFNPTINCGAEFIEIYNNSNISQDLSYYKITGAVEYQFPKDASIAANSYVVVAKDSATFNFKYGFEPFGEFKGDLNNTTEQIQLLGHYNTLINSISYSNNAPWPQNANGNPIALTNVNLNNANGQNWGLENFCGSPAASNITISCGTININSTIVNQSCFGIADGSLLLQPSGGVAPYSYVWSNGLTGSSISNLLARSYTVKVTDNNGCIQKESYTISSPSAIRISKIKTDISYLAAGDGSINVTVSGGTPPYTYNWSNGATTANINNLVPGNYSVNIADATSCVASDLITIESVDCSSISIASSVNDQSYYQLNNGSANINVSGGQLPYTYNWSNGASSSNINNLAPGTYSVTITDKVGCSLTEILTVAPIICNNLNVSTDKKNESCAGKSDGLVQILDIQNGTAPYSILWSNSITGTIINNLSGGTYQLEITDALGCLFNANYVINEATDLTVSFEITNATSIIGNNGFIDLTVNGGNPPYAFNWSNNLITEDAMNLNEDTYWVTIIDANNCQFILNNLNVDSDCTLSLTQQNQPNLTSGVFQVADFIKSNGKVNINQQVNFKAGNFIELNNNFEVKLGAEFEVAIDGCD